MTHTSTEQPEALRLARKFEEVGFMGDHRFAKDHWCRQAAAELRHQHAHITELEAQLSAIGADGVEPMHNREAPAALAAPDERKAFDAANLRDYFGGPLSYRERDIAFMAWQARAALAATPAVADMGIPISTPVTVSDEQIKTVFLANGFTIKEGMTDLKPYVYQAARALLATGGQELEQFIEQVGDVHFHRCRVGSKEGAIRWDIEFGHYGDEVRGKTLQEAITKAIAAQAKKEVKK